MSDETDRYVSYRSSKLQTPGDAMLLLFEAARTNSVLDAKAAILGGADVDAENSAGYCAMSIAANHDAEDVFRLLCDTGASVETALGVAPLVALVLANKMRLVLFLLDRHPEYLDLERPSGMSALMAAVRSGNAAAVSALMGRGAKLVWKRDGGMGILDCLPEKGGAELVSLMESDMLGTTIDCPDGARQEAI